MTTGRDAKGPDAKGRDANPGASGHSLRPESDSIGSQARAGNLPGNPRYTPDDLEILFQDDRLVAITKPSGLSVHRGWDREGPFALQLTRDRVGRHLYPVHRLDRPTSGVLLFALDSGTAAEIQGRFQAEEVRKTYLALVRGVPPESGTIDHPVPKTKGSRDRVPAVTDYVRLGVFERYALVAARPRTGRLHQIRRHMKHASLHLIGDVQYGKGEHNRLFRERFGLHRLALHALELDLPGPDGERRVIRSSVTPDLLGPLRAMGFEDVSWETTDQGSSSLQEP